MKKLKDFKLNVIDDENSLTINGGHSCGTQTDTLHSADCGGWIVHTGDWDDEGCCDAE